MDEIVVHSAKMTKVSILRHLSGMLDIPLHALPEAFSALGRTFEIAQPVSDGETAAGFLDRVRAAIGCCVLVGACWLASSARRRVSWRIVLWGLGLQVAFAFLILRTPAGIAFFDWANGLVMAVLAYALEGATFLFGNLVNDYVPVGISDADGFTFTGMVARTGSFFAFTIFPNIIFVSSLMAVLYHFGVMQAVVRAVAKVMQVTMRTSGAETVCAASNVFVGLMEAPLTVKPFLERMTESELMAVMTVGMATISGGTLVAFATMLAPYSPDAAGHLIAATIMSAPAAFVVAKLLVPETGHPVTAGELTTEVGEQDGGAANAIDAAARGAAEGLSLALVVGAMLIAFVALIALLNGIVGWAGGLVGLAGLTIEGLLGIAFAPLAWVIGVPWADAAIAGQLIGTDFVVNEFVAFIELEAVLAEDQGTLEPRSLVVLIYALTTYANFGSVAMTVAGIGAVAASRRADLARLGIKAVVAGLTASLLTAGIAGVLV